MKLGIYSDPHYSSAILTCGKRHNSESLKKIKEAYHHFENEQCDLAICLGDLIDTEQSHLKEIENLKQVASIIASSAIPSVCVMGNHDAFAFREDEFYEIIGSACRPSTRHIGNKTLIFLDACYFARGEHYLPGDTDWTDSYFPDIEGFKQELMNSDDDTYVFVHQNLDPTIPESHLIANAAEIRSLIDKIKTVKAVYQGHYHNGSKFDQNGIPYITLPAMCENEHAYFTIDL